jgi:hypothetical protein
MSKKLMLVAIMIGLACVLALPVVVCAQDGLTVPDLGGSGLPQEDLPVVASNIINAALGILGLVAVVIILIGGFKWMTAMGNEDNVKKAKALIIQGVIGLVIIVCSWAIAKFVIDALNNAAD